MWESTNNIFSVKLQKSIQRKKNSSNQLHFEFRRSKISIGKCMSNCRFFFYFNIFYVKVVVRYKKKTLRVAK